MRFKFFIRKKSYLDKIEFKFNEPENTACIVCNHVLDNQHPILYVTHDEDDGGWQFLCGQDDHTQDDAKIISLKQVVEIDQTINELYDLPLGIGVMRNDVKSKWFTFKL